MDERMKIYTAENGELRHDTVGSEKGEINRLIQNDRKSRLLLQYEPDGVVRYFFYARKKGRPEQYIAEYSLTGVDDLRTDKQKRDRFLSVLFPDRLSKALDVLGYDLDESHWESKTPKILEDKRQISRPKISDEAKMALNTGASAEVAVPDMESALWLLFNKIGASKSVIISEGGYLDHRGKDDFLIQVDRMKHEVEPIKSSKEEIDKSVMRKKIKDSKSILKNLQEDTVPRKSGDVLMSDALNAAGISDRLGIDVYSKSEKKSIRVQYTALTLLFVVPALLFVAWFLEIFSFENLRAPVVLGEPLVTVVGSFGPYVVRSIWILLFLGFLLLYFALSRASILTLDRVVGLVSRGKNVSDRRIQTKADRLVDTLAEVRRRGSTRDVRDVLRSGTPTSLVVDRESRDRFRRKNILVGVGIGVFVIAIVTLTVVSVLSLLDWTVLMMIAFLVLVVLVVLEIFSIVRPNRSRTKGRRDGW